MYEVQKAEMAFASSCCVAQMSTGREAVLAAGGQENISHSQQVRQVEQGSISHWPVMPMKAGRANTCW